jgi:hypothetical protein
MGILLCGVMNVMNGGDTVKDFNALIRSDDLLSFHSKSLARYGAPKPPNTSMKKLSIPSNSRDDLLLEYVK